MKDSKRVLLLTVGGSPDPLLTAFEDLHPSHVVFFVSKDTSKMVDGPGKPVERRRGAEVEKLDCLVKLMQIGEPEGSYEKVELEDLDALERCTTQMLEVVDRLRQQEWGAISIDYTGGTKTMSSALVLAAVFRGLDIHVTTGLRTNTRAVDQGQMTGDVSVVGLLTRRALDEQVEAALQSYRYHDARDLLKPLGRPSELARELRMQIQYLYRVTDALARWDTFDHEGALKLLDFDEIRRNQSLRQGLLEPLQRIVENKQRAFGEKLTGSGCGFELVEDLIFNAQRRASNQRFDDAVGRFYRALEMTAQMRLELRYQIRTGSVQPEQVPEPHRAGVKFEEGGAKMGLMQAYQLLAWRQDEIVGEAFRVYEKELKNAIKLRNESLFAHGMTPISKSQYEEFFGFVGPFLEVMLGQLFGKSRRLRQLPNSLIQLLAKS